MTVHEADGLAIHYLTPEEVRDWQPYTEPPAPGQRHARLQTRLADVDLWKPGQIAGRRWPIGCVSLEITQRCNLDCTLCYLSEHSEAVRDVPLEEVFRRIDMIELHYGKNTDVQVSGGDPTLRKREELVQIVRRITGKGMRASLFTNGILATRELLSELCAAGLTDVAFHVDTTQQRKGYDSEQDLNAIREKYIDRARGLPLAVFFNTTVHDGNFHEVPALVRFFREHTDVVSLVSFQLQADTGRGVLRERGVYISPDTMVKKIHEGAGAKLRFDTLTVGHPGCNRYAMGLSINGQLYDFYDDPQFSRALLDATANVAFTRTDRRAAIRAALSAFFKARQLWWPGARWLMRKLWSAKRDLIAARGRIHKLSFVIHNFMSACQLERDRLHACVFMVASPDGPVSMCLHNAKRDDYILRPVTVQAADGERLWDPLSGETTPAIAAVKPADPKVYPIKFLKGRTRAQVMRDRQGRETSASVRTRKTASILETAE